MIDPKTEGVLVMPSVFFVTFSRFPSLTDKTSFGKE